MTRHPTVPQTDTAMIGHLRILSTSDLHMQLLNYDYFGDRPDDSIGLINLADQIDDLRAQPHVTTLLFDNGDLIQGNPLADQIAADETSTKTHPMVAALNVLKYDSMTLGNHEFDFGLGFLRKTLGATTFPIVSANIAAMEGPALAQNYVILDRTIICDDGTAQDIKIGVTGFGPPQVADWTGIAASDIVSAAQAVVPQMQAAGADLIVALCHSGIKAYQHTEFMENAAVPLSAVDGIDVIVTGHTHEAFPDPNSTADGIVDPRAGTLRGKPTVMPGYCGKSLGVIDLKLQLSAGRWEIIKQAVRLAPAIAPSKPSKRRAQLQALIAPQHDATVARMQEQIARTATPIHSYFATVLPDLSQQLLARAVQAAVEATLSDSEHSTLPVLAAKSSFRFGGRSGLGHYIDIPVGKITLRDASAIFPFADRLCAIRRTGAQIKRWLERSAAHYNQIVPGRQDQPLINPKSAGYNCDTIYGLSYQIDLTQPARFDTEGNEIDPSASRIIALRHNGQELRDDQEFVVATNSYRASGGGGFPHIQQTDILSRSTHPIRDVLIAYLKNQHTITQPVWPTWAFAPIRQTGATFESAPKARDHMDGPISYVGPFQDGFDQYQIAFWDLAQTADTSYIHP